MERDEEIRKIAYGIWEQEGCINGRDCEHWAKAEQIWNNSQPHKAAVATKKAASKSLFGRKK